MSIAATDIETGGWVIFNQNNTDWDDLPNAVMASSSVPGVFPPEIINGKHLIDGGISMNINLISAIEQCLKITGDQSKVTVDVIVSDIPKAGTAGNVGHSKST